ncbi:ABC transporter permease [Metabacillus malikii]|uniref:ABC-2 type transport system permease protein n=1 Tax=Metabacillus malikii TaxID=1504265 RepID=A0ABT9ZBB1_9BACI|nr:ABC transporter permease [Metabacillus malikii]MDQ0229290.1 ABC-2 type transport system permease protein [Metabacillus malikii]
MKLMLMKLLQLVKKPAMLILLVGPVLLTLLFGTVIESQQEEYVIPIAIIDHDKSSMSKTITNRIKEQKRLVIHEVTKEEAEELLAKKEIDSAFHFKEGFQQMLLQEKREGLIEIKIVPASIAYPIVREVIASEVTRMTSAVKAANQVVNLYNQYETEVSNPKVIWNEAFAYTESQWDPVPLMTIDYREATKMATNDVTMSTSFSPFLGLWGFFTMITSFLLSDWIIKERRNVFSRIRTSYYGIPNYLLQTASAMFIFQMIQSTISFLMMTQYNYIDFDPSIILLMFIYCFISIGMAVFAATFFQQVGSYYVSSILISLATSIFSGSLFPIGEFLGKVEIITTYFPQALLIVSEGTTRHVSEIIILIITGVFLWGWSIWRLQINDKH